MPQERGVMKRKLLFLAVLCSFAPMSVLAVSSCIKLNPDTVCTSISSNYNRSDSVLDCDGQQVKLVGVCAQNSGTADVSVLDTVSVNTTHTKNFYCWCMMVEPVATRWALRANYSNVGSCRKQCNVGCRNAFSYDNDGDRAFRNLIMSNILGL